MYACVIRWLWFGSEICNTECHLAQWYGRFCFLSINKMNYLRFSSFHLISLCSYVWGAIATNSLVYFDSIKVDFLL